jgi:hypothetical protein
LPPPSIPIESHTSKHPIVLEIIEMQGSYVMNCHGQSFDVTANMYGKYLGWQARKYVWKIPRLAGKKVSQLSTFCVPVTH